MLKGDRIATLPSKNSSKNAYQPLRELVSFVFERFPCVSVPVPDILTKRAAYILALIAVTSRHHGIREVPPLDQCILPLRELDHGARVANRS